MSNVVTRDPGFWVFHNLSYWLTTGMVPAFQLQAINKDKKQ